MTSSLGRKHHCASCGARFYDLNKDPAVCPKCGAVATASPVATEVASPASGKVSGMVEKKRIEDPIDLRDFTLEDEAGGFVAEIDTIDTLEDEDEDIAALSELDDRGAAEDHHTAHQDDVEESQLMDEMQNFEMIIDDVDAFDDDARQ